MKNNAIFVLTLVAILAAAIMSFNYFQPITVIEAANGYFQPELAGSDTLPMVRMVNGQYDRPQEDGSRFSAGWLRLDTTAGHSASGFILGCGECAAVVTDDWGGGSGTFSELVLMRRKPFLNGPAVEVQDIYLGDRVEIQSVRLSHGRIFIRGVFKKEDDPGCCPTLNQVRRYNADLTGYRVMNAEGVK